MIMKVRIRDDMSESEMLGMMLRIRDRDEAS